MNQRGIDIVDAVSQSQKFWLVHARLPCPPCLGDPFPSAKPSRSRNLSADRLNIARVPPSIPWELGG
jgi:hypothetical protein